MSTTCWPRAASWPSWRNVCVKLPLTWDGLKACRALSDEGTQVNVTLCFQAGQALLAAKAGATFISPFVGRLDDVGQEGMQLISDIVEIYRNYPATLRTEVLVASARGQPRDRGGSPGRACGDHPAQGAARPRAASLTDKGLAAFLKDWEATGQRIL